MEVFSFLKPSHKIRWLVGAWLWEHCPDAPLLLLIFWVGASLKETISEAAGGGIGQGQPNSYEFFRPPLVYHLHPRWPHPLGYTFFRLPVGNHQRSQAVRTRPLKTRTLSSAVLVSDLCCVLSSTTARKLPFLPDRAASDVSVWGEERGKWARKEAGGSFRLNRSIFHFWAHSARLNVAQDGWRGKWRGGTLGWGRARPDSAARFLRTTPWKWLLRKWPQKGRRETQPVAGWGVSSLVSWKTNQNSAAVFFLSPPFSLSQFLPVFGPRQSPSRLSRLLPGAMTKDEEE